MSGIRYSFGADEHVFAEIDEEMSLEAFFKGMAICKELEKRRIPGVSEICPSNASYLVRFDPDVIHPDKMLATLKEIEAEVGDAPQHLRPPVVLARQRHDGVVVDLGQGVAMPVAALAANAVAFDNPLQHLRCALLQPGQQRRPEVVTHPRVVIDQVYDLAALIDQPRPAVGARKSCVRDSVWAGERGQ